ncbi:MAG: hypothetical protein QXW35_05020 [Candidatus Aenigmatarchaeota archaeon]
MNIIRYDYSSVPTIVNFIKSRKKVKCIMGPIGSGKSSGCVMHLYNSMITQEPSPKDNVRYTRFAIIRNTRVMLKDTTKKTIDNWFPESTGIVKWRERDSMYIFKFALEDGTTVYSEWILRPLDEPDQVRNLLSLELTGAWINEAREINGEFFKHLLGRIGRYPPREIANPTYSFVIMDTNPPHNKNWLYELFEEIVPNNPEMQEIYELFKQPSGLSPLAENKPNLPPRYYEDLVASVKDEDWIRVYVHGEYGYVKEGKPVFSAYSDNYHCAKEPLKPIKGLPIIIGMDFGLTPACAFTQQTPDGRLLVIDEIVSEDHIDIETFTRDILQPYIAQHYPAFEIIIIGDPAGVSRSQSDFRTAFSILKQYGFKNVYPAYTNKLQDRLVAVNNYLTRQIQGEPAFLLSPKCAFLREALNGGYRFKKIRTSSNYYSDVPEKNEYSHIADALQYACLGYSPSQRMHSRTYDGIITTRNFNAFV